MVRGTGLGRKAVVRARPMLFIVAVILIGIVTLYVVSHVAGTAAGNVVALALIIVGVIVIWLDRVEK